MRARLAIAIAQQSVQLREVLLRDKPSELLAISPKATVPVLQLNNNDIIEESLEIMHWALTQHDPNGGLPADDADQAESVALIEQNDTIFKHWLDRYKYADRFPEHSMEYYRSEACNFMAQLEVRLTGQNYLFGVQITLADIAILPFVRQFAHVDLDWFTQSSYTHVQRWLAEFKCSELFASIMPKFDQWQAGDDVVVFPILN